MCFIASFSPISYTRLSKDPTKRVWEEEVENVS